MLSSATKSNAFISYKESRFYKMTDLEGKKLLYFCLRLLSRKCALQTFTGNISRIVAEHVKFFINIFHLEFYYKNQVYGSYHVPPNIFHHSVIILTFHICI